MPSIVGYEENQTQAYYSKAVETQIMELFKDERVKQRSIFKGVKIRLIYNLRQK